LCTNGKQGQNLRTGFNIFSGGGGTSGQTLVEIFAYPCCMQYKLAFKERGHALSKSQNLMTKFLMYPVEFSHFALIHHPPLLSKINFISKRFPLKMTTVKALYILKYLPICDTSSNPLFLEHL